MYTCAKCPVRGCNKRDYTHMPENCPYQQKDIQAEALYLYTEEENQKIAYNSALINLNYRTRLEETIEFMKLCGYHRIGLAFCTGLWQEANTLTKILEHHGFEVVSVICKNGSHGKSVVGITDQQTNSGNCDKEIMCNPIGQALLLNEEKVDFSIIFGLCVGHDTLAIKYIDGPSTVLAVKDRITGHNPLAPIYTFKEYYSKKIMK